MSRPAGFPGLKAPGGQAEWSGLLLWSCARAGAGCQPRARQRCGPGSALHALQTWHASLFFFLSSPCCRYDIVLTTFPLASQQHTLRHASHGGGAAHASQHRPLGLPQPVGHGSSQ